MRRMVSGLISPPSRMRMMASRSASMRSRRHRRQAAELSAYSSVAGYAVLIVLAHTPLVLRGEAVLRAYLLQPLQRRTGALESGPQLPDPGGGPVFPEAERFYEEGEGEPLQDERRQDHGEGEEED